MALFLDTSAIVGESHSVVWELPYAVRTADGRTQQMNLSRRCRSFGRTYQTHMRSRYQQNR